MKNIVKIFVFLSLITVLGNYLYWGNPKEYSTETSPNGRYRLVYYNPEWSWFAWVYRLEPYFVKIYINDGGRHRYICTTHITDWAVSGRPVHWPWEEYKYLFINLDIVIPQEDLEGFIFSLAPTLERICP
ncbi:hypothetical protein LJB82_01455 [Desulfovibrio sp. OttesenSCG-928-M16]|nr:hypothetical protein [Desulfovibrio sp. OttesenSCG-928-M16]